ncbi:putative alpha crystallin/Hsp20 domain, HSP20-like chaperone [Helianthus annuus]|nr:putative alpha crystallin/Hsp20 domain, HSP20-like chaperone [Helianthus annuus]
MNNILGVSDHSRIKPSMSFASLSFIVDDAKYFKFNIPGLAKTETDESLSLFVNMPGVKKEHVKACVEETRSLLSIQGQKYEESYYGGRLPKVTYHAFMGLPNNFVYNNTCIINTEMPQDGMFEVTLPKLDRIELKKTNFFTNIYYTLGSRFTFLFFSSIPSVIMTIARPLVVNLYCPLLYDSFTMYKEKTAKSLHMSLTPGPQKMDFTRGGGWVLFLNMPELKIEDVKSFVKCGTLFIEGKTKTKTNMVQYITGIRLPEYLKTKRNMIKTELQDGLFKITVPSVDTKINLLSSILSNIISSIIVDFISKRTCSLHGSDGWTSRIFTRLNKWTFKWAPTQKRWTKYTPDELEIEFPVCGLGNEADIDMRVDVKNRFILVAKNNEKGIYYKYYQQLPRCGNFEKAHFKSKLDLGLLTVNVKNFQKEEVKFGFD